MTKPRILIIAFLIVAYAFGFNQALAARYARYNTAGYHPEKRKQVIILSDDNVSGEAWRIRDGSNNIVLQGTVGASVTGSGNYTSKNFNHVIDFTSLQVEGDYTFEIDNTSTFSIKVACQPYAQIANEIVRMFRVRRSGSNHCLDHDPSHFGDVSCPVHKRSNPASNNESSWQLDAGEANVDMAGGWYDAGDYIKFTLTIGQSCYNLLRAYEENPALFDGVKNYSPSDLDDLLDEAKHGLDYLMKTMPSSDLFIIQTGGNADHNQWPPRLPEDDALDGSRECYAAKSRTQMGLTAASLALGADIFEDIPGYGTLAANYRAKAIEIYNAAKASTEANAWWEGAGQVFYADNSINDNMALAAIELYNVTGTGSYLTEAVSYANAAGSINWGTWSNMHLTAFSRIYKFDNSVGGLITTSLNNFQGVANQSNNIWGLPHNTTWGSTFAYFTVAHGALMYQSASGSTTYEEMGLDVLDYTFGANNWGQGFIASQSIPNTITTSYAAIYRLQPSLFPHGEIAEGPTTSGTHSSQSPYFSPAHNPGQVIPGTSNQYSEFNTSNLTFFEQEGDYVCMETTIGGLSDGLLFLAMSSKLFCESSTPTCPTVNLGSDVSLCGVGSVTLNSGVATDGVKTYTWERDGGNVAGPNTSATTFDATIAGTYQVTVDSAGVCSETDQIIVSATLGSPDLGANIDLCSPSVVVLDAGITGSGITYSWKKNNVTIGGETSQALSNVNSAGTYEVTIGASGCGLQTDEIIVTSSLPEGVNDTICSSGIAGLSVSGGTAPYNWYLVPNDGSSLHTGSSYSPNITGTTSFYVEAGGGSASEVGGRTNQSASGWNEQPNGFAYQLEFDALQEFTLDYVKVYANGAQTVTLTVLESDNSTVVGTANLTLANGENRVPVGITIPVGTNYRMDATGTGSVWLDDNASYPYTTAGVVSIHTFLTPWGTEDWYWAFYNWEMSVGSSCDRVEVVGVVDPSHASCTPSCQDPGTISLTPNGGVTQCGGSVTITATESGPSIPGGYEYEFFGGAGSIQGPGSNNSFVVNSSGNYYVVVTDLADPTTCSETSSTVSITIDENPSSINLGSNQTLCADQTIITGSEPLIGSLDWTIVSGSGNFSSSNSLNTTISNIGNGPNTYRATVSNGSCPDQVDEITITRDQNPTIADAGTDISVCTSSANLSGNVINTGSGTWAPISGCGTLTDAQDPNSMVSGLCMEANVFRWTSSNGVCPNSTSDITITRTSMAPVSVTIDANQNTVCEGSQIIITATGNNGGSNPTYEWFEGSTSLQGPNSSNTFTYNATTSRDIHVVYTSDLGCASNNPATSTTETVNVDLNPTTTVAGLDQNICSSSATLDGNNISVGSGSWTSVSGCAVVSNTQDPNSLVSGLCDGANIFRWTSSNGVCPNTFDEVIITKAISQPVSVSIDLDNTQVCEGSQVVATATSTNGGASPSYEWFVNSTSIQGPGTQSTLSFTPTINSNVNVVLTSSLVCSSGNPATSNIESVSVDQEPSVSDAGIDQVICASSTNLSGNIPVVGNGIWSIIAGAGSTVNSTDENSIVNSINDDIILRWTITNGVCAPSTDDVFIDYDCPNAISDQLGLTYQVYPNPVLKQLVIDSESIWFIELYNSYGVKVMSKSGNLGVNYINIEELPAGMYMLNVTSEGIVRTHRLIKE